MRRAARGTTLTLRRGQSVSALPQSSDVDLFGYGESVIDLDAQIADSALDLAVTEQELNVSQIACSPVDQGRFGPSEGMRAKEGRLQPDLSNPVIQQARILASRHRLAATTGK